MECHCNAFLAWDVAYRIDDMSWEQKKDIAIGSIKTHSQQVETESSQNREEYGLLFIFNYEAEFVNQSRCFVSSSLQLTPLPHVTATRCLKLNSIQHHENPGVGHD